MNKRKSNRNDLNRLDSASFVCSLPTAQVFQIYVYFISLTCFKLHSILFSTRWALTSAHLVLMYLKTGTSPASSVVPTQLLRTKVCMWAQVHLTSMRGWDKLINYSLDLFFLSMALGNLCSTSQFVLFYNPPILWDTEQVQEQLSQELHRQ